MKEEYEGERILVKLSKSEILKIMAGKILEGHKVTVGLYIE